MVLEQGGQCAAAKWYTPAGGTGTPPLMSGSAHDTARLAVPHTCRGLGNKVLADLLINPGKCTNAIPTSPLLDTKWDSIPQLQKQLSFRFQLDDGSPCDDDDDGPPMCLVSVSFVRQQLRGTIHVKPSLFPKRVFVRYTCNNWKTAHDTEATFSGHNSYFFTFDVSGDVQDHDCVAFCYACELPGGNLLWDNNRGSNYCADVLPTDSVRPRVTPVSISRRSSAGSTIPMRSQTTSPVRANELALS